jgi:hypothetical protein
MPRNFDEFNRRINILLLRIAAQTVFCWTELAFQFRHGIAVNASELRDTASGSKRDTKRTPFHDSLNPTDSLFAFRRGEAIPTED